MDERTGSEANGGGGSDVVTERDGYSPKQKIGVRRSDQKTKQLWSPHKRRKELNIYTLCKIK